MSNAVANFKSLRAAEMPAAADLLANARFVLEAFTKRGGSVERSFLTGAHTKPHHEDMMRDLTKCARCHRKMLGSFDRSQPLTWANATGRTPEAAAATVLINAGELVLG